MPDLNLMPLEQLEALCDQDMIHLLRQYYRDKNQYRAALVKFVCQPKFPLDELLGSLRASAQPLEAWRNLLEVCRRAAPKAPWNTLPCPHFNVDIASAKGWLEKHLRYLPAARGIYLSLDTMHMRDATGINVSIGSSISCDPQGDSSAWVYDELFHGAEHQIRSLYDLYAIYSQAEWLVDDPGVPGGDYFSFANYLIFLGYSGIVFGRAFNLLPSDRFRLVAWGFSDGDVFLLGRQTPEGFALIYRQPPSGNLERIN